MSWYCFRICRKSPIINVNKHDHWANLFLLYKCKQRFFRCFDQVCCFHQVHVFMGRISYPSHELFKLINIYLVFEKIKNKKITEPMVRIHVNNDWTNHLGAWLSPKLPHKSKWSSLIKLYSNCFIDSVYWRKNLQKRKSFIHPHLWTICHNTITINGWSETKTDTVKGNNKRNMKERTCIIQLTPA